MATELTYKIARAKEIEFELESFVFDLKLLFPGEDEMIEAAEHLSIAMERVEK